MNQLNQHADFSYFAHRYVWWGDLHWALNHPKILLACVMNYANWEDMQHLRELVSDESLINVLKDCPPGIFSRRSWDFWHHRLGVSPIPERPARQING